MGLGWVKTESVREMYIQKFFLLCYTAARKEQIQRNRREHYETTEFELYRREQSAYCPFTRLQNKSLFLRIVGKHKRIERRRKEK